MIGTITYILARAGWRAMNGQLTDERRRLAGAEPPAAYVSYDPRLLAGVGWYGYRIAFKGGDRQMIERARYMLSECYTIRDSYEYYADGVYIIGVLLRQRVPHYGIGGGVPTPEPDALNFTMPNGGTINLKKIGSPTVVELEYLIEGTQNWVTWVETDNVRSLTLTAGQKVFIRNTSETQTGFSTSASDYYQFAFVGVAAASGNCNSLLCKIPNIVTTLANSCYQSMFQGCTSLVLSDGFTLPATTLANSCYQSMFQGCTSLTLPDGFTLPATTLAYACYYTMFYGCTSLTLPDGFTLPATTLATFCYDSMFYGCTSLTLPDGFTLPATTLANSCYQSMFQGCTSLTLPDGFTLPATTLAYACYYTMFYGCTSLTLPDGFTLPATTLAYACYQSMFQGCTSLVLSDGFTLPATTLAYACYYTMFYGCTSLTLPDGFTLPATTLATFCYAYMFYSCTSLTLPDGFTLPATTLANSCYQSMFQGCTSLTLPDGFTLPATTLADSCYQSMFRDCTLLNKIRTLMTDISASNCLTTWIYNVSPTGDFYCPAELTIPTGASGIPSGWTRHDI